MNKNILKHITDKYIFYKELKDFSQYDTKFIIGKLLNNNYNYIHKPFSFIVNNNKLYNNVLNYCLTNYKSEYETIVINIFMRYLIDKNRINIKDTFKFNSLINIKEYLIKNFVEWYNYIYSGDRYINYLGRNDSYKLQYYYKYNRVGLLDENLLQKRFITLIKVIDKLPGDVKFLNDEFNNIIYNLWFYSNDLYYVYELLKLHIDNNKVDYINSNIILQCFLKEFMYNNYVDYQYIKKIQNIILSNIIDVDNPNIESSKFDILHDNKYIFNNIKNILNKIDDKSKYNKLKIIKNSTIYKVLIDSRIYDINVSF